MCFPGRGQLTDLKTNIQHRHRGSRGQGRSQASRLIHNKTLSYTDANGTLKAPPLHSALPATLLLLAPSTTRRAGGRWVTAPTGKWWTTAGTKHFF